MATSQAALAGNPRALSAPKQAQRRRGVDLVFLAGLLVVTGAIVAGIAAAGISVTYFFQPAGRLS